MRTNSNACVRHILAVTFLGVLFGTLLVPTKATAEDESPPPPKRHLEAPGRCTYLRHKALQDDVKNICRPEGVSLKACESKTQTVYQMAEQELKFIACATTRVAINVECFEGGDDEHKRAVDSANGAAKNCRELWLKKEAHERREAEKKAKAAREKAAQAEKERREKEQRRAHPIIILNTTSSASTNGHP